MKREYIYILVFFGVFLYFYKKKNMNKENVLSTLYKKIKNRVGQKSDLVMAQILHEVGGKVSNLAKFHNYSGIVYVGQKYALDSHIKQPDGKFNYAKYKSMDDYLEDYLRIVKNSLSKSNSINEFATNLKNQKYYGDTIRNYSIGMLNWYQKLKDYE